MELRDYQIEGIEKTRASIRQGHTRPLLVYPVGSGKTVMFSSFTQRILLKQRRVLILAHRAELLDQCSEKLREFTVPHSFCAAGREFSTEASAHVGSVQTVIRRLAYLKPPDVIIVDEAHHSTLETTWGKIIKFFPKAIVIGVTASPFRLSGEAMGDIFDDLIVGPQVDQLIERGYLSKYRIYAPVVRINTDGIRKVAGDFNKTQLEIVSNNSTVTGDAIGHYRKLAGGKRAVAFCVSIAHAKEVAMNFQNAGFRAATIDGSMERQARRDLVEQFRAGDIDVMTSCDVISEGFDLPAIECALMLRPTHSLALWIQQTGRAMRPFPGKECAIILDHAGNCARHGLPDDRRDWTLESLRDVEPKKVPGPRTCPECRSDTQFWRKQCPYCMFVFEKRPREIEEVEGDLEEVDASQLRRARRIEEAKADSYEALLAIEKQRGYRPGWAWHRHRARQMKKMRATG